MNAHQRRIAKRKMDRLLLRRYDTSDLIEPLHQATEKVCRAMPASLDSLRFSLPIGESAWQESHPETIGARVGWPQASFGSDHIGIWAGGHEGTDYPQMRFSSHEKIEAQARARAYTVKVIDNARKLS